MRRNNARLVVDGEPVSWLGANFWSRTGGPLMWRDYDPEVVRAELAVLAEHGLGMTRSFFYWPDFMPEPDRIDEELAARFADFLDLHTELGLSTVPTFIVGHMSGENWDPSWRNGRDLYSDVWLVGRQAWFAGEMVRRFARHPAVCGWLVSNEMPIYGGSGSREAVSAWALLVLNAIRAAGGTQPVSLGDGAWGIENSGQDTGFSLRDSAALCDFLGPHVYRMEDDQIRQHLAAAWECELAGTFGRPVVLEEFGVSSNFASDEHAADYYRQTLHNSLLAGATGWIAWNNTDYDDLVGQDPYRHHPFEMHFGLTDRTGAPKPALRELREFHRVLAAVDFARCRRADSGTVLVIPSYLEIEYPFTDPADRAALRDTLRQSYVAARLADAPPALSRETDGIATDGTLYLLPSTKQLLGPSWYELERLAEAGATVYVSYSAGTHGGQRGPWYAHLNEMFGVRHQLRYGLVDPITSDEVTFEFVAGLGPLAPGARLVFPVAGSSHGRCYLPVEPVDAEVLAVDGEGRPALLRRPVGTGSIILCTYPIEQMAARTPRVNPEATSTLYNALAEFAGVDRPVTVADPHVAVDVLRHADGHRFAWLVSQAETATTVVPTVDGEARTLDGAPLDGGAVTLSPFGVHVLRLP